MKVVDQVTGEDLEAKQKAEREQHAAAGGEWSPSNLNKRKGGREAAFFFLRVVDGSIAH
jgi:hypothetical protein